MMMVWPLPVSPEKVTSSFQLIVAFKFSPHIVIKNGYILSKSRAYELDYKIKLYPFTATLQLKYPNLSPYS